MVAFQSSVTNIRDTLDLINLFSYVFDQQHALSKDVISGTRVFKDNNTTPHILDLRKVDRVYSVDSVPRAHAWDGELVARLRGKTYIAGRFVEMNDIYTGYIGIFKDITTFSIFLYYMWKQQSWSSSSLLVAEGITPPQSPPSERYKAIKKLVGERERQITEFIVANT